VDPPAPHAAAAPGADLRLPGALLVVDEIGFDSGGDIVGDARIAYADDRAHELYGNGRRLEGRAIAGVLGSQWLGPSTGPARDALQRSGWWVGSVRHATNEGVQWIELIVRQRCDGRGRPTGLILDAWPSRDRERLAALSALPARERDEHVRFAMSEARLRRLQAVSTLLIAAIDAPAVGEVVCREAVPASGAACGTAVIVHPGRARADYLAAVGCAPWTVEDDDGVDLDADMPLMIAIRSAEPLWVSDLAAEARWPLPAAAQSGRGSLCALPLRLDGPAFGAIGLTFPDRRQFDADERNFLLAVAYQCALALDRVRAQALLSGPSRAGAPQRVATLALSSAEPATVAAARRFARGSLDGIDDEVVDVVRLCVSELVSNVVLHAGTTGTLRVTTYADRVLLEVDDHSPRLPRLDPHPGPHGGRGLQIIDHLASSWDVVRRPWGKTVWAEIRADSHTA
jgi:anti-sigma regulatory factor (Ser/Thr protein kinase)